MIAEAGHFRNFGRHAWVAVFAVLILIQGAFPAESRRARRGAQEPAT